MSNKLGTPTDHICQQGGAGYDQEGEGVAQGERGRSILPGQHLCLGQLWMFLFLLIAWVHEAGQQGGGQLSYGVFIDFDKIFSNWTLGLGLLELEFY